MPNGRENCICEWLDKTEKFKKEKNIRGLLLGTVMHPSELVSAPWQKWKGCSQEPREIYSIIIYMYIKAMIVMHLPDL